MNNTSEWDDIHPENPNAFDWGLSMQQIEKKYNPAPKIQKQILPLRVSHTAPPPIQNEGFSVRFKNKFPYAYKWIHSEIDPEMWRWIVDNLITKKI